MTSALKQCGPDNADLFFNARRTAEAVELCRNCPATLWCRGIARAEGHLHGTWGGETADERRAWLVLHHPDPDIGIAAQAETNRLEYQRGLQRRARANERARRKANVIKERPALVSLNCNEGEPTSLQKQAGVRADQARQMYKDGGSTNEIAFELGTSKRSVERYLGAKYDNTNIAA